MTMRRHLYKCKYCRTEWPAKVQMTASNPSIDTQCPNLKCPSNNVPSPLYREKRST